jgi:hypothetical protein
MACGWSIFVSAEYEIKSTSQDMLVKYAVSMKLSKHISIWKTHLGSPLHSRGDIYFSSCPSIGHKSFVSATSPALLLGIP